MLKRYRRGGFTSTFQHPEGWAYAYHSFAVRAVPARSAACVRAEILAPETVPAAQLTAEAASAAEEVTLDRVVELESCLRIKVLEVVD